LSEMPASHARNGRSDARIGARARRCRAMALQGNLPSPGGALGSRRARMGPPGTRHLTHSVWVFYTEHGRLREGWEGAWDGGKGDPNETPRPSRRVGGGRGVCTRESRGHQDEDGGRRPLAFGKKKSKE